MDPMSQAGFGATLSQSSAKSSHQWSALIIGGCAGMAPDLDVLISSREDPLLFLEYHRQFTHSLLFIPVGALICALIAFAITRFRWFSVDLSFRQIYLFSFLGYATHGLLDACTSYGTQLFWPFSDTRIAWNSVSIVDPLFTLPVIVLIVASAIRKKPVYARIAFVYAVIFLAAGLIQKTRAEQSLYELAESRGHQVERMQVKPTFANRHVWKIIYESGDRYYVDAVRLLLEPTIIEGDSIRKLDVKRDFPWLPEDSQHARDIERFRWFSDDFVAVDKDNPSLIFDVRYSFVPNQIDMMWGIELDPRAIRQGMLRRHVKYQMRSTQDRGNRDAFIDMVMRF